VSPLFLSRERMKIDRGGDLVVRKQLQLQISGMRSRVLTFLSESDQDVILSGFFEDHADSWRCLRTVSRRCVCVCVRRGCDAAGVAVAQQGLAGRRDLVRPPISLRPRVLVMLFL